MQEEIIKIADFTAKNCFLSQKRFYLQYYVRTLYRLYGIWVLFLLCIQAFCKGLQNGNKYA